MRLIARLIKYIIVFNVVAVISALIVKQFVQSEGDETTDEFTLATVMFGSQFASTAGAFRHGSVITYMGGVELDLSDATLDTGARLTLLTVMGGVEVRVPSHWRIDIKSDVTMGDSQVQLEGQDDLADSAPVFTIDARTVMGGFALTNTPKRTTAPTP